jgi:hypothetical protein
MAEVRAPAVAYMTTALVDAFSFKSQSLQSERSSDFASLMEFYFAPPDLHMSQPAGSFYSFCLFTKPLEYFPCR